jgi:hypothetical protein
MDLKTFLIEESKNSKFTDVKSERARTVMEQMKALVQKGIKVSVVIDGKPYTLRLNADGKIIADEMN